MRPETSLERGRERRAEILNLSDLVTSRSDSPEMGLSVKKR
jgi:hypothetical protein